MAQLTGLDREIAAIADFENSDIGDNPFLANDANDDIPF